MRIIDTHTHVYPGKISDKAVAAIGRFYDKEMLHRGTPEDLIASGNRAGVTDFLVFSTATVPGQVQSINNYILSEVAAHSCFLGAGTIHAEYEHNVEELERIRLAGMKGIKFHPEFQKFAIDDRRLYPAFAYLEEQGMFFITHAGDPRYDYSNPPRIERVAKDFPDLKIIAAHFGGFGCWEEARRRLAPLENVYYDTSSTYGFGGIEPMAEGIRTFMPGHLFYASDYPMWDQKEELDVLDRALELAGADEGTRRDIRYNNFARFYGLEEDTETEKP